MFICHFTFPSVCLSVWQNVWNIYWSGLLTFVLGASGAIRQWVDSIRPAMASSNEVTKGTKDRAELLAEARQARKDALDTILELIPDEEEPKLTSVYPKATHLLALALAVARRYTDEALRNIHTQLTDLAKEHIPEDWAGAFLNTILQVTCSFDKRWTTWPPMRSSFRARSFPIYGVPTGDCWRGSHSLDLGHPSCLASWPASLVEQVTPAPHNVPGSSKTPMKFHYSPSGAAKTTLDPGKKSHESTKQVVRSFWGSPERGKEDAEARKLQENHQKKSTGPVLSLDDHEDSVINLVEQAAPSRVSQPPNKGSGSKG